MARKIKRENTLAVKAVCIICAVVLVSGVVTIGAMNLFCTDYLYIDYSVGFTTQSVIHGIAAIAATAGVFAAVYNLLRLRNAYKYMLFAAALLRILSALFWKIEPESDFLITYELSKLLSDTSLWQWGSALDSYGTIYNDIWSAHMPFIVYQSLFLRITDSAVILRLVNAVLSWSACVLCAKTARTLGGERSERLALCIMALNPAVVFFIPVLTNQHVSQFFFVLAVWALFSAPIKNIYIRAWISGACIAMSHLMRPEMQVVVIAVTVFVIYTCFKHGEAGKRLTVYAAGMCTFLAVIIAANTFLVSAKVIHRDIYSGNLNYKIMVGLNPATNGSWSESDSRLIGDDEAINLQIQNRLKSPLRLAAMMYGKAAYQMGSYVYSWSYDKDMQWISDNIMRRCGAALMALVCLAAVWKMLLRRRYDMIWIYLTLMGYAMTYSIIEVQGRYSFIFIPMLVLTAVI